MARAEAAAANGIDFVIVATPNDLHCRVARAFLTAASTWCATSRSR